MTRIVDVISTVVLFMLIMTVIMTTAPCSTTDERWVLLHDVRHDMGES